MKLQNKKAFTLVELIVVITILAILWTIAFISLQWFSRDARNSTRSSDLKNIEKVLYLYQLRQSEFPLPSNDVEITYSWAEVWTQWTFWEDTRKLLGSQWQISNVPTDPLTWSEYTYSRLNTKNEMQLAAVFEWDLSLNQLNNSYADWVYWTTKITWNYNGQVAKTWDCTSLTVLAVPSIISWDLSIPTLESIISNKNLLYNKSKWLPASYSWSIWFSEISLIDKLTLVNDGKIEAYTWTCDDLNNIGVQDIFIDKVKEAYDWTEIEWEDAIASIINITSWNKTYLAQTIIRNSIIPTFIITASNDSWPVIPENYPWCDTPDITFGWITIAACNVWSNTIWIAFDDSDSYGDYIQFGKSDNSWINWTISNNSDWKYPGWLDLGSAKDWWVKDDDRIIATYANSTPDNKIKMQWPCSDFYHVPTSKEWEDLKDASGVTNSATAYSVLKIPVAGYHNWDSGGLVSQDVRGYYRSASPSGNNAYRLYINSSSFYLDVTNRAYGNSVRCFRN